MTRLDKVIRYLNTRNLEGFMSLWDDSFIGWPDYSEHPVRKSEIRASFEEEFRSSATSSPALPAPKPEAVEIFGNVAIPHYFWPDSGEASGLKIRATHTWRKGPQGWRIIGGMSCDVQATPVRPGLPASTHPMSKQRPRNLALSRCPGLTCRIFMLGVWSIKATYAPSAEMPNGDMGEGTEVWRPGPAVCP